MPLSTETLDEIDAIVRSGFESRDRIIVLFCEERYAEGDLDPDEVAAAVDSAVLAHGQAKANWAAVTDCDRLDHAFIVLESRGIICLQHAGYTQSDGYDDFRQILRDHPDRDRIRGYCFYHSQDTEKAVQGGGLCLAFGPVDPRLVDTEGPVIGKLVVDALMEAGLPPEWNGSFAQRILIPRFLWRKR